MQRKHVVFLGVVIAAVAGWMWWPRSPAASIVNVPPRPGPIVAFGDSLTYGTGAPRDESYVAQLSAMIGRPVLNHGVPGQTIGEAAGRLRHQVLAARPSIVIVLLGGNDMLRRKDLDASFETLEGMIRKIQDAGAMVVLVGLKGLSPVGGVGKRYRDLARRTGCVHVADILDGIFSNRELMADPIHPNGQGYHVVAERIAAVLRPYLAQNQARQ